MSFPKSQEMLDERAVSPDGLPPPTIAQVRYWRDLCQVVNANGVAGMPDGGWPADLAPSSVTLTALVARHLLVRRAKAWHLRRHWQVTLAHLQAVAVPTPRLHIAERPAPDLPTFAELAAWEPVCRWLDAQPRRRARLPFAAFPDLPITRLHAMRKYRLLRHTTDCQWTLSPTWKERLLALWQGVIKAEGERPPADDAMGEPVALVAGLDTWYLNRLDPLGLPPRLRQELDALQAQARAEEQERETPWTFDESPLVMYQSGVSARQGGGVSWSYILRNRSLTLLLRRTPLGQVVGQVRFSSECLWRRTPRVALDEVDRLITTMWGLQRGEWQVSQAHLAHDVAHLPIDLEQLGCYVSRSRSQAVFDAARQEIARLRARPKGDDDDDLFGGDEDDTYGVLDDDDLFFGDEDLFSEFDTAPKETPWEDAEDRGVTVYRWGTRLSGVVWSAGAALSVVQYDKRLEMARTGRRHMAPLWQAAGWDGVAPVTRTEARLRRSALRGLRLPGVERAVLDDPWEFLEHLQEVWAVVVGQAPECPDQVEVAWLRRVVPDVQDVNRSRWPTDPAWRVVQDARFTPTPLEARRLIRAQQQTQDVDRRVQTMYGALVSYVALQHDDAERFDVSAAIREAADALTDEAAKPQKDFGLLARERRRKLGLPVPAVGRVLPFRAKEDEDDEQPDPAGLDVGPGDDRDPVAVAVWRMEMAGRRMREALDALERARGTDGGDVALLQAVYEHEAATWAAALERVDQL